MWVKGESTVVSKKEKEGRVSMQDWARKKQRKRRERVEGAVKEVERGRFSG